MVDTFLTKSSAKNEKKTELSISYIMLFLLRNKSCSLIKATAKYSQHNTIQVTYTSPPLYSTICENICLWNLIKTVVMKQPSNSFSYCQQLCWLPFLATSSYPTDGSQIHEFKSQVNSLSTLLHSYNSCKPVSTNVTNKKA